MLLRLSKTSRTYMAALLPTVALLLWIPSFLNLTTVVPIADEAKMPLYQFVYDLFNVESSSLGSDILAYLIVTLQAFLILAINNSFPILSSRSILPSFIFILLSSTAPALQYLHPALFGSLFFIFALISLLKSSKLKNIIPPIYEASFFISLGSLFYFPTLFLAVIVFATLMILKAFNWREWFIVILGIATPYFIMLSLLYFFDTGFYTLGQSLRYSFGFSILDFVFSFSIYQYLFIAFCSILLLISATKSYGLKIQARKYYSIILASLVLSFLLFMAYSNAVLGLLSFILIPLSIVYGNFFFKLDATIKAELLYFLFILLVVIQLLV